MGLMLFMTYMYVGGTVLMIWFGDVGDGSGVLGMSYDSVCQKALDTTDAITDGELGAVFEIPSLGFNAVRCVIKVATWDYPFFSGDLALVKNIIIWPVSIISLVNVVSLLGPVLGTIANTGRGILTAFFGR